MIRTPPGGFRLTFLGKFVLVTFVLYLVVASALAAVLIAHHEAAVEANEGANAVGQISALATQPLISIGRQELASPKVALRLAPVDAAAERLQFVNGIHVYRSDGTSLYPAHASSAAGDVRRTLQIDTLWSKNASGSDGQPVRREFVPFASPNAIFVIAADLSRPAMQVQAMSEARGVMSATAIAIGLVFISLVALAAGASREIERRRRESEETFVQTLGVLAETIDRRDPYTAGHSRRVATYSRMLASELCLSLRERDVIEHAALLHDVGKIGIPDAVLLKPGKLDERERAIMSAHPRIGSEIIGGITTMEDLVPCVLHHHERIDGSGYPDMLKCDEIPRGARIIAVADSFDAMTTDRPYRRALSVPEAVRELRRVAGTQLEAKFVEAFAGLVIAGVIVPPRSAGADESLEGLFGQRVSVALRYNA